jgi:hypothetical protein
MQCSAKRPHRFNALKHGVLSRYTVLPWEKMAFQNVAEAYIEERLGGQKKGDEVARDIRRVFVEKWSGRSIDSISRGDVADIIRATAKKTPAQSRNLLGYITWLFDWAQS